MIYVKFSVAVFWLSLGIRFESAFDILNFVQLFVNKVNFIQVIGYTLFAFWGDAQVVGCFDDAASPSVGKGRFITNFGPKSAMYVSRPWIRGCVTLFILQMGLCCFLLL